MSRYGLSKKFRRPSVKKEQGKRPLWGNETTKTIKKVKRSVPKNRCTRPKEGKWDKGRGYPTSFMFDSEQYVLISELAYEEQLSKKEFVYRLIEEGLKRYFSGELDMTYDDD